MDSDMNLLTPLDPITELERGAAGTLWGIADCGRRNLVRLPAPTGPKTESAGVVVVPPVLERVAKRLS